jgi:valyl-tRNA synthetase
MRSEMNVPPAAQIELTLKDANAGSLARLATHRDLILRMARLSSVEPLVGPTPKSAIQAVQDEATLVLPLEGIVDLDKERARLTKEIDKLAGEIKKIDAKLSNEQFVAKAPDEVIEEQRDRRAAADQARDKLQKALDMLSA